MKKSFNIFCCCAAATMLAAGCDKPEQGYDPGIEFSRTGQVTLIASIENCSTRASLVNTGEARWQAGDVVSVVCTDGTAVEFTLDGTGETRKAFFKGTIPDGKQMGGYALHPASATLSESTFTVELPDEITPSSTSNNLVMAAEIEDSYEITFRQLISYLTVQIGNVNSKAVKIELKADKSISGTFSATLPDAFETGIAAESGSDGVVISIPDNKETTITATIAVPVGEYGSLKAIQYDADDENIGEVECLTAPVTANLAGLRSVSATLPDYSSKEPIEGTALVAGIYWALGNLQHVVGSTDEGFQTDWRIAPEQWEYINCENAKAAATAVTFNPADHSQYDHFNWGGIISPFDNAAESSATAPVGTDISGKMYTSQDCSAASMTTDFTEAKFGDIAYWASNGKFRMPTPAELQKLIDEASSQYGSYTLAEGKVITGYLFTDPESGEEPVNNDSEVEFSADDIAKGLFLPKGGRRYGAQSLQVATQGTQGPYWGSTSITDAAATSPFYGSMLAIVSARLTFPYFNAGIDTKAGLMIRPVYIEEEE